MKSLFLFGSTEGRAPGTVGGASSSDDALYYGTGLTTASSAVAGTTNARTSAPSSAHNSLRRSLSLQSQGSQHFQSTDEEEPLASGKKCIRTNDVYVAHVKVDL